MPVGCLLALLLALPAAALASEQLVCRGFPAEIAARAVSQWSELELSVAAELAQRPLWFVLPRRDLAAIGQALAVASGSWWSDDGALLVADELAPAPLSVRAYGALPRNVAVGEELVREVLAPWLAPPAGLAQDPLSETWTASLPRAGHERLQALFSALAGPAPRPPALVQPAEPALPLPAFPASSAHLAAWAAALAAGSGWAVALAPGLDPRAPAPPPVGDTAAALAALRRAGYVAELHHRCLGIAAAPLGDRRHPAQRAAIAVLALAQLGGDDEAALAIAATLRRRLRPECWRLPGWTIAALRGRRALLVVADPPTIHAVLEALEDADRRGLSAWLAEGER